MGSAKLLTSESRRIIGRLPCGVAIGVGKHFALTLLRSPEESRRIDLAVL
mgnify:CR=1 FL=1